jgi:hypothetical protein
VNDVNDKKEFIEQPIPDAEADYSAYLDFDNADVKAATRFKTDDLEPERLYEESKIERKGLYNPRNKQFIFYGACGLIVLMLLQMGSCQRQTKVAASDPRDAEIEALRNKVKQNAADKERNTAGQQAKDYTKQAPGTDKPKNTSKKPPQAYLNAIAARNAANSRNLASQSNSEPVSPRRVVSTPILSKPAAPVVKNDSEVKDLRKKLAEMARTIAKLQAQGKNSEIASAAVEPEGVTPSDEGVSVSSEPPTPVDGGVEEVALLSGTAPTTIKEGTEAKATLDVPLYPGSNKSKVLLTLKEPILNESGQIAIPKGSRLMGYAGFEGDMAEISIEMATINGRSVQLPGAAQISVFRENKKPIVAKANSGSDFWSKVGGAALDGISSGVNQLISPDTTSTISNGSVYQSSKSSGRTLGNAGLAALGGVSNGISSGLKSELQSSASEGQTRNNSRAVAAGLNLKVIFLTPTQLVIPNMTPVKSAQLSTG